MDALSQRALALVLPVHIRPLVGLIAEFVGVSLRCEVCDEKGALPIRFESGAWSTICPECHEILRLSMSDCDNSAVAVWLVEGFLAEARVSDRALVPQWRDRLLM